MWYSIVLTIYFLMWYLLIFVAIVFCISGLDDVFYDVVYWVRYFIRKQKLKKYPPLTYIQLATEPEKSIAILLPAWQESDVIEDMLKYNANVLDYKNYDFFVGTYPNDPDTTNAVKKAAAKFPHIHCVISPIPGPTGKAANLNQLYNYIQSYEKETGKKYEIILMHDAEDIIHPLSLKLYNYLIPRKDMVQIPVFPLEVPLSNFTHWVYNDEFSEAHTKDIVVREAIGGFVPSAGVGTAFSRFAVDTLIQRHNGILFETNSLTEDYNIALQIRLAGLKQIFVTQSILRKQWKRRFYFFGEYVPRIIKEYIATRAFFPYSYMKSVRQKSRWVLGISIQEWINSGWPGNFFVKYTLFHDRKSLGTYFVNILAYLVLFFWFFYSMITFYTPEYPSLQERFSENHWVWYFIVIATIAMLSRIIQRVIACYRLYGFLPSLLSIPRIIYGNFISFHALLRALGLLIRKPKTEKKIKWEKTAHHFPILDQLAPLKRKLGDLVLDKKIITQKQLMRLLDEQAKTGKQLGELMKQYHYIDEQQLSQLLATQYHLTTVTKKNLKILPAKGMQGIRLDTYNWLLENHCYPCSFIQTKKEITLAIESPSNQLLLDEVRQRLSKFRIKYVMLVASMD